MLPHIAQVPIDMLNLSNFVDKAYSECFLQNPSSHLAHDIETASEHRVHTLFFRESLSSPLSSPLLQVWFPQSPIPLYCPQRGQYGSKTADGFRPDISMYRASIIDIDALLERMKRVTPNPVDVFSRWT